MNRVKNLYEMFPECADMPHDEMIDILSKCENQFKTMFNKDFDYELAIKAYYRYIDKNYETLYAWYHMITEGDLCDTWSKEKQSMVAFENLIKYVYMKGFKARLFKEAKQLIEKCHHTPPPEHETT